MTNGFSGGDRRDSPIDRAIDRAVREMVQVDPALGLRRRVLSRLESTPPRGSRVARYAWGSGILAMMVVVLMMLVGGRPSEPLPAGPNPAQVSAVPAPVPRETADLPIATPAATPPRRGASPRVTREAIRMPQVENVFGAPSAAVSAAAAIDSEPVRPAPESATENMGVGVAPLVIVPLAPAPLEMPAIVIQPLETAAPKGGR
jgi:hypothetical protein